MKTKLYIIGLISISLLAFSCLKDDFENHKVENYNTKLSEGKLKDKLNAKIIDSASMISRTDGEPSNPKPPRKD